MSTHSLLFCSVDLPLLAPLTTPKCYNNSPDGLEWITIDLVFALKTQSHLGILAKIDNTFSDTLALRDCERRSSLRIIWSAYKVEYQIPNSKYHILHAAKQVNVDGVHCQRHWILAFGEPSAELPMSESFGLVSILSFLSKYAPDSLTLCNFTSTKSRSIE